MCPRGIILAQGVGEAWLRLGERGGWHMSPSDSQRHHLEDTAYLGGRAGSRSYSPLQAFFLLRLNRLLRERQDWVARLTPDDWRLKLLSKAIYSTFCDCVEQGVTEDARTLFAQTRTNRSV